MSVCGHVFGSFDADIIVHMHKLNMVFLSHTCTIRNKWNVCQIYLDKTSLSSTTRTYHAALSASKQNVFDHVVIEALPLQSSWDVLWASQDVTNNVTLNNYLADPGKARGALQTALFLKCPLFKNIFFRVHICSSPCFIFIICILTNGHISR